MLKRILPCKKIEVDQCQSKLDFLRESLPVQLALWINGHFLAPTTGCKSAVKWFLRFLYLGIWSLRVAQMVLSRKKSLFLITGYIAEFVLLLSHIAFVFKCKSICQFFSHLQNQLNSIVEVKRYKKGIRVVVALLVLAEIVFSVSSGYLMFQMSQYAPLFPFAVDLIYQLLSLTFEIWIVTNSSLYVLALIGYFIRCDIQLNRFKFICLLKNRVESDDVLHLARDLQKNHLHFEEAFSFLPFLWLSYGWCTATIYGIGITLGPLKELSSASGLFWSAYVQATIFVAIGLAIATNKRICCEISNLVLSIEQNCKGDDLKCPSMTYAISRMEKASEMKLTAWGFCFLQRSLVFNYLSSLISFSVLTLQLDTSKLPAA